VAKAVRAGSRFDLLTTLVVLIGYAIPGFVLGVALLVIFGGQLQWFPAPGVDIAELGRSLSWGARIVDYLWHIALPVTAMVLGSFAVTTMLTKNAFLEEIRKLYVLTAQSQRTERAAGAVETHVPQRVDPDRHRLSGGVHRRLLYGLAADRDPVLARRPGLAEL
jgi:ABC-type microcin C transport system permease subunit YejB